MWLVDMVSRMRVWLECIGVVSGCCCKEVYRYPHNNYYFSLLHLYSLFFGSSILTSLFILKTFFRSCLCYFCTIYIANVTQRTFEIVQKSSSRECN